MSMNNLPTLKIGDKVKTLIRTSFCNRGTVDTIKRIELIDDEGYYHLTNDRIRFPYLAKELELLPPNLEDIGLTKEEITILKDLNNDI